MLVPQDGIAPSSNPYERLALLEAAALLVPEVGNAPTTNPYQRLGRASGYGVVGLGRGIRTPVVSAPNGVPEPLGQTQMKWSEWQGSNLRPPGSRPGTLPLSYTLMKWSAGLDSNQRPLPSGGEHSTRLSYAQMKRKKAVSCAGSRLAFVYGCRERVRLSAAPATST